MESAAGKNSNTALRPVAQLQPSISLTCAFCALSGFCARQDAISPQSKQPDNSGLWIDVSLGETTVKTNAPSTVRQPVSGAYSIVLCH